MLGIQNGFNGNSYVNSSSNSNSDDATRKFDAGVELIGSCPPTSGKQEPTAECHRLLTKLFCRFSTSEQEVERRCSLRHLSSFVARVQFRSSSVFLNALGDVFGPEGGEVVLVSSGVPTQSHSD